MIKHLLLVYVTVLIVYRGPKYIHSLFFMQVVVHQLYQELFAEKGTGKTLYDSYFAYTKLDSNGFVWDSTGFQ